MQNLYRSYLILLWVFIQPYMSMSLYGQDQKDAYYFEEEDIVFVFDVRTYAKALLSENALNVDFADLGIYDVAITGTFNNWNKKGWKMAKRSEFVYELRKKIHDFSDAFPLDFRYIINGRYIADAEGTLTDPRQFKDDFLEDIYKVDLSVLQINPNGPVRFFLEGHLDAKDVVLTGSFNNWNEHEIKLQKIANGWELKGDLPPGRYEYKFLVDSKWMHDPANRDFVKNEHGTYNSVLWITRQVVFVLKGHTDAKKVILAGSFNHWSDKDMPMKKQADGWTLLVPLTGGKQTYKFVVDGHWIVDPDNPIIEDDGHGNQNSVRFVH